MSDEIPMARPDVGELEEEAVLEVLRSPMLSTGPRIDEFETRFADYVGAPHACAVSSGTAALHLAVIAAGVGEGDAVLTTPFSFVASTNAFLYEGAVPIFVDIEPETFNVDPAGIEEAADALCEPDGDSWRRWLPPSQRAADGPPALKAILPVDVFGQPAEMEAIGRVARRHDLAVIEDGCEAIGAEYRGRRVGELHGSDDVPDAVCFGFYPNKQITTGEGGMIVTGSAERDALFRSLRNQGRDVFDEWLEHTRLGYNYRLDEMSSALGIAQLGRIEDLLEARARVAALYTERLSGSEGVETPSVAETTTRMSWFVYVVRLAAGVDRDAVMRGLDERGVPSRPYFTPIHLQPYVRDRFGFREGDFPITEMVAGSTLALPFSGSMNERDVDRVCDELMSVIEECR